MRLRLTLNSLTTRLILLGMTLLITGALSRIVLLTDFLQKDVTELTSSQLSTLANYVAKDIDHDIIERRDFLERVTAKLPLSLLKNPQQLRSWLGERYDINPLFSQGIFVLDLSGKTIIDYPALPERAAMSYADCDYFQQAIQGSFTIGRPVIGRIAKAPVLPMAIPILDTNGKVQAVLVGVSALHSPNFMNTLYTTHVGKTGGIALLSLQDKLFIGASDADVALTPIPKEGIYFQHNLPIKGTGSVGINVRSGVEELAVIAPVLSSGWFVVARIPTLEVYGPSTRLRHFIEHSTLIIMPLFLLVMVFLMRHILRPLMTAAQRADQMTQGEIPFEPLPVARNDEVGHLTVAFNRVLSKLLESRVELQHIAHHDTLTGLPNRQLLADRMSQALARAQRNQGQVAVLFLDLDGFKPINDELGHKAGDTALREVANRLSELVRKEDTLARVGGDEFVILLSDLNENAREVVELVANKCLAAFQQPFVIHGNPCLLGTSIGIAMGASECGTDRLLIAADHAMYKAKDAGRGQFYWSSECPACTTSSNHDANCSTHIIDTKHTKQ
ncbi:cyclic di-GMP phosphodiesterase Gmr [mine drainage metagenome]|uniref:Cyclic di-GMP phosphodiesterase Gmr n=1 Tax=mine drainage metagenome TaxID=410659 RepID=A0A1J5S9I6_9ZZZZ